MANQLLNRSRLERSRVGATPPKANKPMTSKSNPKCWMYREDCPEGRVFDANEVEALEADGWKDAPIAPADPYEQQSKANSYIEELEKRVIELDARERDIEGRIAKVERAEKTAHDEINVMVATLEEREAAVEKAETRLQEREIELAAREQAVEAEASKPGAPKKKTAAKTK